MYHAPIALKCCSTSPVTTTGGWAPSRNPSCSGRSRATRGPWARSGTGGQLQWASVGNTIGFGHGINDGRPFWAARFSRTDKGQILFYFGGDGHCWLGTFNGSAIDWTLAATFEA